MCSIESERLLLKKVHQTNKFNKTPIFLLGSLVGVMGEIRRGGGGVEEERKGKEKVNVQPLTGA